MQAEYRRRMREKVYRLSRGMVDYDQPAVTIDPVRIEMSLRTDERGEGEIRVKSSSGEVISGVAVSHNIRMHMINPAFSGENNVIRYFFDAAFIEPGEVISGEIALLMDAGEFIVPYVVSILHGDIMFEGAPVRNLFLFTNLARQDFAGASKIFASKAFEGLIAGSDRQYMNLYRGYAGSLRPEEALDDFLCEVKKKQPLRCRALGAFLEDGVFTFAVGQKERIGKPIIEEILIDSDGWGCMDFTVTSDSLFLEPMEKSLKINGRQQEIKVMILPARLHPGCNLGRLTFKSETYSFHADFCIRNTTPEEHDAGERRRNVLKHRTELIKLYISYCIKNINRKTYEDRILKVTEKLMEMDGDSCLTRLLRAHALIEAGEDTRALTMLLESEKTARSEAVTEAYHTYLISLTEPGSGRGGIAAPGEDDGDLGREQSLKLHRIYEENNRSDIILWLLLHTDRELMRDPAGQLIMIKKHFDRCGVSPLLYLMSFNIYVSDPGLMESFGGFEVQVLNFAVKTGLYDREFTKKALYMMRKQGEMGSLLIRVLSRMYEDGEDSDVLLTICTLLMKKDRMDDEAFTWYAQAVERDLNITRLIDYYMYSMPDDYARELPKVVQLYFRYGAQTLGDTQAALYANLIQYHYQIPEILDDYREQMLEYGCKKASEGAMSPALSVLYSYLADEDTFLEAAQESIGELVFYHHVRVKDDEAEYLIVVEDAFREERRYAIKDGSACVPVYGRNYELFVQRKDGSRKRESVIEDEPLLYPGEFEEELRDIEEPGAGLCVYFCERVEHCQAADDDSYPYMLELVESREISDIYKKPFMIKLLRYYEEQPEDGEEELAGHIDMSALDEAGRVELMEVLLRMGRLSEVLIMIRRYGLSGVSPRILVRVLMSMSEIDEMREDDFALWLCYECFVQGKYDERILGYLSLYLDDTSKSLRSLWRAAESFGMDTAALEERILEQMMYTGAFVGEREDIFDAYEKHAALPYVELAWLTSNAHDYTVMDKLMDDRFFLRLIKLCEREEVNNYCALAFIQYCHEMRSSGMAIDGTAMETAVRFIRYFLRQKIVLGFFMSFVDIVPELQMFEGSVFVEHKASPGAVVTLNYIILPEKTRDESYERLTMKAALPGIFSTRFVLFYGQSIQYYIAREYDGRTVITESECTDMQGEGSAMRENRYELLNEMAMLESRGESEELMRLMGGYVRRDYFNRKLFVPV